MGLFCKLGRNGLVCHMRCTFCSSRGSCLYEGIFHRSSYIFRRTFGICHSWRFCRRRCLPLGCVSVPFWGGFIAFTVLSLFSRSFACTSLNSRALPAFMRPAKSRSSRRALGRRGFDWQFKMICSLISLSGFAKSQVFARLLRRV